MDFSKIIVLFWAFTFVCAFQQELEDNAIQLPNLSVFKKKEELKSIMKNEVQPLLTTIKEATNELNLVLGDIESQKIFFESYRQDLSENLAKLPENCLTNDVLQHSTVLKSWNFSKCGNFSQDCIFAAKLAINGTLIGFHIGYTVADIVTSVMNCPTWNIVKAYKCYESNINEARDLIQYIKTEGAPLIDEAVILAKKLTGDFKTCMNIPQVSHIKLYAGLKEAKCQWKYQ